MIRSAFFLRITIHEARLSAEAVPHKADPPLAEAKAENNELGGG